MGVLSDAQVRRLLDEGQRRPEDAAAAFARALGLRAAIYRVFQEIALGATPAPHDLATVQQAYLVALAHAGLAATGGAFDWMWSDDAAELDQVLWPVARSAVDLLTDGKPNRVKECAGPAGGCGWLFYDTRRNARHRWCSMEECGIQAKMRRYYARRRAQSVGS